MFVGKRAGQADWCADPSADVSAGWRGTTGGQVNTDDAANFWADVHSNVDGPGAPQEIERLEEVVFSRVGTAETAVDFVNPGSGATVRAMPSQLRLSALLAARDRFCTSSSTRATEGDENARAARAAAVASVIVAAQFAATEVPDPPRPHRVTVLLTMAAVARCSRVSIPHASMSVDAG